MRIGFILVTLAAVGCAPSLRMLHQSNVYFERCNTMDMDTRASRDQRMACWTAWREYYADAQPPERLEHADGRIHVLTGKPTAKAPILAEAAPVLATTAPVPPETSADASVVGDGGVAAPGTAPAPPAPDPSEPVGVCTPACAEGRTNCTGRCPMDTPACVAGCNADYDLCVKGCL